MKIIYGHILVLLAILFIMPAFSSEQEQESSSSWWRKPALLNALRSRVSEATSLAHRYIYPILPETIRSKLIRPKIDWEQDTKTIIQSLLETGNQDNTIALMLSPLFISAQQLTWTLWQELLSLKREKDKGFIRESININPDETAKDIVKILHTLPSLIRSRMSDYYIEEGEQPPSLEEVATLMSKTAFISNKAIQIADEYVNPKKAAIKSFQPAPSAHYQPSYTLESSRVGREQEKYGSGEARRMQEAAQEWRGYKNPEENNPEVYY